MAKPINDVSKTNNNDNLDEEFPMTLFQWSYRKEDVVDQRWQIGISIFLLACFALFLWQKNYLGSALVLLIIILVLFFPRHTEEQFFAILDRGIMVEKEIFPWKNLESFWIFEKPTELYIKNKKGFPAYISLPLHKKDITKVKNILLNYLPEKATRRSPSDTIGKKIGL